jgi:hypothetical protein
MNPLAINTLQNRPDIWKNKKNTMRPTHTLLDFSDNHSFILQDAVQGFLSTNNKPILPFIDHINDQHLKTLSFWVISDCLYQNTLSFYALWRH